MGSGEDETPDQADASRRLNYPWPQTESSLIPDHTIVSDLLDGLRVERTYFSTFHGSAIPPQGRSNVGELVGLFFIEGAVRISIPDMEPIHARRSDYLLIGRNLRYDIAALESPPATIGRVVFKLDNVFARLLFRLLPPLIFIANMTEFEIEWHTMLERLVSGGPASAHAASSAVNRRLIEASLISLLQTYLHRESSLGYRFDSPDVARIYPALCALHQSPERTWTVAALAKMASMSRTSFVRKFSDVTGEAPAHYLSILRLDKARELLRAEHLPLSEVAERVGYGSDMAFIRAFKRQFGSTPGEFRVASKQSHPLDVALPAALPKRHYD